MGGCEFGFCWVYGVVFDVCVEGVVVCREVLEGIDLSGMGVFWFVNRGCEEIRCE